MKADPSEWQLVSWSRRKTNARAQHSRVDTRVSGDSHSREGQAAPTARPRLEKSMQPIVVIKRITDTEREVRPRMPREPRAQTPNAHIERLKPTRCANLKSTSRTSPDCVTGASQPDCVERL